ncbi:MAG: hypothetical protein GVY07_09810, partial [Bacteroidetes bacterium]|nr:hypothetical protein [Bacteroidota bacterium]
MKKVFSLSLLILISTLFFLPQQSIAQVPNFGVGNIQNVNVNNLTDDQLRNFYQQMQSQGLTPEQVGSIARARGMPANQASQLVMR